MIWLIGVNGMLGADIKMLLENNQLNFVGSDVEIDITDLNQVNEYISGKEINWIINCAAYTAVDKAESEPRRAHDLNAKGAKNLAIAAKQIGAKLIQFSTDYVFDGKQKTPYSEDDPVSPTSVYGKTKLEGEGEVQQHCSQYYIIRISWLYGIHGNNFVKTMLRLFNEKKELGVINDQIGGPTYTKQLVENIILLLKSENRPYGIYHYSDDGSISWYNFACQIKEYAQQIGILKKDPTINPITTDMYPLPAKRPVNSTFKKEKAVKLLGFKIKDWKENLKEYLDGITTLSGF
jgi:dTDP-4-dehydrorhamnose reductase